MTTKLYTAAEARRIDKALRAASKDAERGGRITRGKPFERAIQFNEKTLVWGFWWANDFEPSDINSEELLKEQWMPLTAFLNAEQSENPEPEPIVLDYLVLVDANERIKQLEKELAEIKKERDNDIYYRLYTDAQKQRDEYKDHYHEILADHGELTRKFDELKEKQRRKSCKDEKPTTNQKIIFLDGNSMLQRGQYIPLHSQWYLHVGEDHYIALASSTVENWTWKYEADL